MKVLLLFFGKFIFLFSFIYASPLFAKEIGVASSPLVSLGDIHYGQAQPEVPIPETSRSLIYVKGSCYSTSLRRVSAQLSSLSEKINLHLDVTVDGRRRALEIKVPVSLVSDGASRSSSSIGGVSNRQISAKINGNNADFKQAARNSAAFQFNDKTITKIHSVSLTQASGSKISVGTKGQKLRLNADGSVLDIKFSVPVFRTTGYTRSRRNNIYSNSNKGRQGSTVNTCGGFYSPLMVFFNKKRPSFKNVSNFPLVENASVYWPEKNAPGYFLVLDRNKDGKITKASELFRNSDKHANGFNHLATLDGNKDGLIDRDDKMFGKLQLWKDKNANGISEKSELFYLKDKNLYYISLKAKNIEQNYGNRAKAVERSFFTYKNQKGNFAKSEIVDFWFSVAGPIKPKVYKSIRALSSVK